MKAFATYCCDPWINEQANRAPVPSGANLVCRYRVFVGVDHLDETVWFRRQGGIDELWISMDDIGMTGRAVRGASCGTRREACELMLAELFHARAGFGWPTGFRSSGMLDEGEFQKIVQTVKVELDSVASVARSHRSLIVRVADNLGLVPEPSPRNSRMWQANCPGTGHFMLLNTEHEQFWCGYCNVSGDAKDLEEFVSRRKR